MELDPTQFDLEQIRQYVEMVLAEWNVLVEDVPTEELPRQVYLAGTGIALTLWFLVARVLPSPMGRITWIGLFALLCSPTVNTAGDMPQLVPACVAFVYGALTKNMPIMLTNGTIILTVFGVGLLVAFMWERIKATYVDMMIEKQQANLAAYEQQVAMQANVPNIENTPR